MPCHGDSGGAYAADEGQPAGRHGVGTYNAHGPAMAAVRAALTAMRDEDVLRRLHALTSRLQEGFEILADRYRVPAVLVGAGGHFQPYFCASPPRSYREALASDAGHYASFAESCEAHAILVADKPLLHCALSTAHADTDVDAVLAAAEQAFSSMETP